MKPRYILHGVPGNRSAIIRNAAHYRGERFAHMKRIEFRAPDPSCNPYFTFSAIISAGLEGIKKKTSIPNPIDEDIFKMTPQRRHDLGIRQLPATLREAYEELSNDREFLKPIFDDEIIDSIILQEVKDHEDVTIRPHPHEFSLYADV